METTTSLIQKYNDLFKQNALTEDEYNYIKKELLDQGDRTFENTENLFETTAQKKQREKSETSNMIFKVVGIAVLTIIVVLIFKGCVGFFSDIGSDNVTYYQDSNGNGYQDDGEFYYTEDPDGNVVDIGD